MRPLTDGTPKPLLPFLGVPVLWGWLRRLADEGIVDVHLLVGADPTPFDGLAARGRALGLRVTVHDEDRPLHSAGALRAASTGGAGPMLVINADVVTAVGLRELIAEHRRTPAVATLLGVRCAEPHGFGVIDAEGGRVVRFREKPPHASAATFVNGGVYVLDAAVVDRVPAGEPCDLEAEILPALVDGGAWVGMLTAVGGWADLGTPSRYLAAHRRGLDHRLRWPRSRGLRVVRPGIEIHVDARVDRRARLAAPVLIEAGARVEAGASVGPHVVLAGGAEVGTDATVRDAVVLDHASVLRSTTHEHVIVSRSVVVRVPAATAGADDRPVTRAPAGRR